MKIDMNKIKKLENQLDLGFLSAKSDIIFYIKYKRMIRTYNFTSFPFIYCIIEIKFKTIRKQISKNIVQITFRKFRKHKEYYKKYVKR